MLQFTDPERLSNKEGSGGGGIAESLWEGELQEISWVHWEQVEMGTCPSRFAGILKATTRKGVSSSGKKMAQKNFRGIYMDKPS